MWHVEYRGALHHEQMIGYVRADPSSRIALAPFLSHVRASSGGTPFPATFDSGFEETKTKSLRLEISEPWLRMRS